MIVNIHGKSGSGMAQIGLDIFDIIAGLQGIDGKAVSQIVKTIVRQFCPLTIGQRVDKLLDHVGIQCARKMKVRPPIPISEGRP